LSLLFCSATPPPIPPATSAGSAQWPSPAQTAYTDEIFPTRVYFSKGNKTGSKSVLAGGGKDGWLAGPNMLKRFEEAMLPHLGAAYNLARWLTRNGNDAEDLVQEAFLRAFKSFEGFRGGDARVWLLWFVGHTGY